MWDPIIMICLTFQGLKKQEAWMDNIRSIMDERGSGLDSDVRRLLETIIKFDNIPRKRNKFINFVQVRLLARSKTRCLVTSIPRSFPRLMCLCFHCSFTSLYNKCITIGRWIVILAVTEVINIARLPSKWLELVYLTCSNGPLHCYLRCGTGKLNN